MDTPYTPAMTIADSSPELWGCPSLWGAGSCWCDPLPARVGTGCCDSGTAWRGLSPFCWRPQLSVAALPCPCPEEHPGLLLWTWTGHCGHHWTAADAAAATEAEQDSARQHCQPR